MAMTVSYSVVPRKNPAKKSEPAKYYAQAQASGELDFEELCEAITSRSTCTETDVRAAISGILYEVKRALKAGRIARLGDLGSLQICLLYTSKKVILLWMLVLLYLSVLYAEL